MCIHWETSVSWATATRKYVASSGILKMFEALDGKLSSPSYVAKKTCGENVRSRNSCYQTTSINKQEICWIISCFELSKMWRNNQTINPTLLQHFLQLMDLLLTLHNHRLLPLCSSCLAKSIKKNTDPAERIPPPKKTPPCFPKKTWNIGRTHPCFFWDELFPKVLFGKKTTNRHQFISTWTLPDKTISPWLQPGRLFLGPRKGFGQCNTHQTDAIHQTSRHGHIQLMAAAASEIPRPTTTTLAFEMY